MKASTFHSTTTACMVSEKKFRLAKINQMNKQARSDDNINTRVVNKQTALKTRSKAIPAIVGA